MGINISAIVIAKNEEKMIADCLESLSWVDEIILIDTGSSDKTIEIAKKYNAKIYFTESKSFDLWRNFGAEKASGKWLLYIDADERVTPLLAKEIKSKIIKTNYSAFDIPRSNIQLGHVMKYGGWPDSVRRLIKKDSLVTWLNPLHEQPDVNGEIGRLDNYITHITHRSIKEMIDKTNLYSEYEAKLMFEANHPPMNIIRFISAMMREGWYRGITKQGFRDGWAGIIEIVYQMFSRFVSYSKLWELQENGFKRI